MSASAFNNDNPLEAAATQMRNLCSDDEPLPRSLDRGSVGRMLVHIDNIKRSVIASTQDHLNAAKRLNDFALIFARLARNSDSPDGALAMRMTSVANNLRAASQQLAGADAVPEWRGAEPGASK